MSRLPRLLILVLLLAACGTSHHLSLPKHLAPDFVRWGIVGVPDLPTLDPALASDPASLSVASMVFGGLVRFDDRLNVIPDGASSWTISNGGRVYTFLLRHNLRFADGRPVVASDFAHALTRALSANDSTGTAPAYLDLIARLPVHVPGMRQAISGIQALGPSRLRLVITRPAAHFLAELAFPASFVPDPSITSRYGAAWTDHAAGFGPYIVTSWRHSRSLLLQQNPHYFGVRPRAKRITITFYSSPASATEAYERGKLDLVSNFAPGTEIAPKVAGMQRIPALALDYLAFNTHRLPFRRLNARRAFAAIWSHQAAARVASSRAFVTQQYLPPGLGASISPPRARGSASAYLARAHYPGGRNFPDIALVAPRDPQAYALGRALQTAWSRVLDVTVTLRQLDPSTYNAVLNAHDFDLAIVRWGADYPDPQDFLETQLGTASTNITGWSTPSFQRMVSVADSYARNDPRRAALFRSAEHLAERKLPLVPLDVPSLVALASRAASGFHLTPLGTVGLVAMRKLR